jgi:outer membrane receptor protein involved in Fe transport
MTKGIWFLSTGLMALAAPVAAQETPSPAPPAPQAQADGSVAQGDIIVTATRRSQALSDVPLAVSAVTSESLQNSGASDLRQLNQLSPSLLVSSTESEASAAAARIRGIGTVGNNAGLESSVATFIDGVYRSRTGTGMTELGAIDRIEVLRGPQGTLFGRNASAGLIHVITAKPKFEDEGTAEASYGNYDYWRGQIGLTGPINDMIAYRIDGVYTKRDGFLRDVVSKRDVNNRDRWLARGQLLFVPNDQLEIRIIGDYAKRNEECCAAVYLPAADVTLNPDGTLNYLPSSVAAFERAFRDPAGNPGVVSDDPFARDVSITPGRTYRSDVRDWGLSGEINYDLDFAKLTSITAYRDWHLVRGQDADYNNLDLLVRPDGGYLQGFKTFTQELRLQGDAFGGVLDWLVGAYYADEKLSLEDNLQYGSQYGGFYSCLVGGQISPTGIMPGSAGCLSPALRAGLNSGLSALGAAGPTIVSGLDNLSTINGAGNGADRYKQDSRNYAFFTHNVVNLSDQLSLTFGLRYTNERKKLDATFAGSPGAATACAANVALLTPLLASPSATLRTLAGTIRSLSCVLPPITPGSSISDTKKEDQLTGTAVLSFKPTPELLTYASYSKGYKAGGYNLDRQALNVAAPGGITGAQLQFQPEKVDAFEIGAKYNGRGFDINIAAFYQLFEDFQLNAFTGTAFIVENIEGCSMLAEGDASDSDNITTTGLCTGKSKAGVVSKGVEIEAFMRPSRYFTTNIGFTYADTKYRSNLSGVDGRPLAVAFFQLPGRRLSNSGLYTITGAAGWTPPIGGSGLSGLVYADFRYQSELNTGSDLDVEKIQQGVMIVNARVGLRGPESRWGIELWAQNLLDTDYKQVGFDAPIQPGGSFNTIRGVQSGFQARRNQLFNAFLAEPRTYGVTVRTKF